MKLTKQEKAARKAAFRTMPTAKKLDHIFTYYKWPILLALIAVFILGSVLQRKLTQKEPVLYLALANVSVGSEVENKLITDFISFTGSNHKRQEVYLYRDLYLSENADTLNHEYAYASQMKIMGSIQAKKLDVTIMNREAYDIFSQKGYLADLSELLSGIPDLREQIKPLLTENEVIISDNSLEVMLREAEEEIRVTETVQNAIDLSSLTLFQNAGFDGEVYLGLVANTPRKDMAVRFIQYLSVS